MDDAGVSLPDNLIKVVNRLCEVGLDGTYNIATVDGANALTWSNVVQWFLVIDEANDKIASSAATD
ncbi:hypothetical protein EV714DRAFT_267014 [Schizophyllum commune]